MLSIENAIENAEMTGTTINTAVRADQLIRQLNWRYATKQFDPKRKISEQNWVALEEALRLTSSSGGLQPWRFVVVTDPGVRAKLRPASHGQAQITDASHLVVFAAKTNLSADDVDAHVQRVAEVQGVPLEALTPLQKMLVGGIVQSRDEAGRAAWARNQVYIALGNLLTSAALLGIDACPMEGFDPARYDDILELKEKGLAATVVAALGYRLPTDKYAQARKVRFEKEHLFIHI
ncbi:MAG: putative NAD(P)H nitroreductase YfkO [Elusimicrobia bacterium]|nr:putative NAD(P)H nitroreductase YfkO [Elusimicrobiota bacterium]